MYMYLHIICFHPKYRCVYFGFLPKLLRNNQNMNIPPSLLTGGYIGNVVILTYNSSSSTSIPVTNTLTQCCTKSLFKVAYAA